ncbi:uncharacterized protein ATC70_005216 [Mucor velutinosus]|uniref:Uncharacterized protein n=1 Tax=Mucor velutinosus TaxID=708070 RepID=A0AAN7D4U1_9FUNG|nr:hypothetical protein ATC70_005216 [Mucor velutinosus]
MTSFSPLLSHVFLKGLTPLASTPMNPNYEFQILNVPIKKRLPSSHMMRQQLRDIGLPSHMAVDVHYPAANILSLIVRNKHFVRCQNTLHAAHLTTVPDFIPLDPAHSDPSSVQ